MKLSSNPLSKAIPIDHTGGSTYCASLHAGIAISKEAHAIDGNGAQTDNIFIVGGPIELQGIFLYTTAVGDATTFSNVKFDMDDGAVQLDLSTVVNGSGIVAGSVIYREDIKTNPLLYLKADQVRVQDAIASKKVFEPTIVVPDGSSVTYIRLCFTGDGATDITGSILLHYQPLTSVSEVTAV